MLQVETIPAFKDNYIWAVGTPDTAARVVVDPGEAEPVLAAAQAGGWPVAAILITHHHHDHTGGAAALADHFGAPVYGPRNETIAAVTAPLGEGDPVDVAGLSFTVLETPGHTRGHLCYYGHGALFCGDTLFSAGCGRLFEGTAEQMWQSLARLAELPTATRVYCAHEYTLDNLAFARVVEPDNPAVLQRIEQVRALRDAGTPSVPSTLAEELQTNPFLRSTDPRMAAIAGRRAGREVSPGAETFAVLRGWKDSID